MYHDQCPPRNMSKQFSKAVLPATGRADGKDLDKGGMTICQSVLIYSLQIVNLFKNLKIGRVKLLAAFGKG